jgi:type IV pilus assembly protein PilA
MARNAEQIQQCLDMGNFFIQVLSIKVKFSIHDKMWVEDIYGVGAMRGRANWRKTAQIRRFPWVFWVIFLLGLGVAGLVVLPSFLNQGNKCCGLSTKFIVGALLRSQQAFFIDNRRFANSLDEIMQSSNIRIDRKSQESHDFTIKTTVDSTIVRANTKKSALKSYIGAVFRLDKPVPDTGLETAAIVCEAKVPGQQAIQPPLNAQTCGADSTKWVR